jgi:DNA topoisomerase-6 subunit A
MYEEIKKRGATSMHIPVRNLSNAVYDESEGYLKLVGKTVERKLSYITVKTFAQSLRMIAEAKKLIDTDDIASKREMYYVAKGDWGECKFNDQADSDSIMDDVEALFEVNREELRFIPEEKGGDIAGRLTVIDVNPTTGKKVVIKCDKFGTGAYSIPSRVDHLEFETNAKFILVIETSAMFQRLVYHEFWKKKNCILIAMGGVPTRACRRFIRILADKMKLPVYVFTDGDPYGYGNIYRTLKVGSGNAAHVNKYFCVPQAKFLGVTPDDIDKYDLHDVTYPLSDTDIKRAKDSLKNDSFIMHHRPWQKALKKMIKMGVRVEQQAFAKHGLNYVLETYLPQKLRNPKSFLP